MMFTSLFKNRKLIYGSVGVIALFLAGCISIYSPHSGVIVEQESGLPIENAILVRSWDRVFVSLGGDVNSRLTNDETTTDENGNFSFWPRIFFSGIPLIMWTEENSILIYRPGYGFSEIKDLKNVIELPKIPFNRNTRGTEANKARSSYSTDYYKTELLRSAVQQEEKLIKELPESTPSVLNTNSAQHDDTNDRQMSLNQIKGKNLVNMQWDCQTLSADNSEIYRLIGRFNSYEQKEAVLKVACYGDRAIPALLDAMSSSSNTNYREIRTYSLRAVARIGTPRAIEVLTDLILKCNYEHSSQEQINEVMWAIEILEHLGPNGEKALVRSLANKSKYIQSSVSEALGRTGGSVAVSGLIANLPDIHSAKALGKIKDPRAVEGLVATLPLHQSITALGEIKDFRAVVPLMREINKSVNEVNVDFLLEGNVPSNLTIEEKKALRSNIPLISEIKNQKDIHIEEVLSELSMPSMPKLYEVAANVPINIGLVEQQEFFFDYVVQLLVSRNMNDRFLAEVAIAKIGQLMVPALAKALGSSDDIYLRKAAAKQLGRMKWETSVEKALVKALQDRNPLVAAYSACALGEHRAKSALGPLIILSKKESHFERRGAIWAIAKIGSIEGIAVLKESTNDKDEYVRKIAKKALESFGI